MSTGVTSKIAVINIFFGSYGVIVIKQELYKADFLVFYCSKEFLRYHVLP